VTIHISDAVVLNDQDIQERFVRARGPRGQNLRHEATAVELRFDVRRAALPDDVKARLANLAGRRMTRDGMLVVASAARQSQGANRKAARERLLSLLVRASHDTAPRVATRPRTADREQRLSDKHARSEIKTQRGRAQKPD